MSDAKHRRPPEASAPLAKAKVMVAFARSQLPSPQSLLRNVEFPLRAPTVPGGVEPVPKEKRTGVDYDTEWARRPAARAARRVLLEGVVRPAMGLVADPEVRGLDRLGNLEGPAIFAANHHSHLDTSVLLAALPARFRHKVFVVAAADYFFTNRVTGTASALALNAIPFERTRVTRRSSDLSAELIADGWNMAIFPEGGRSPDGWGQEFRPGAAYLALKCGVPLVPVHLWGTDRLLPKGARRLKRGSTVVTFGTPIVPTADDDSRRLSARLEQDVAALADEATSDWWSARLRSHAGSTPPLSGPAAASWRRTWALGSRDPHQRDRRADEEKAWP